MMTKCAGQTSSTLSTGIPVHNATIFLHMYSFSELAPRRPSSLAFTRSSSLVYHVFNLRRRINVATEAPAGNGGSGSTGNETSNEPPTPSIVLLFPSHAN